MIKNCLDLSYLYSLDEKDHDAALDYLFDKIDDSLYSGHERQYWPDIKEILENFDVYRSSTFLLVGILSITKPIKDQKYRKDFFEKVRNRLIETEGIERAESLTRGFK